MKDILIKKRISISFFDYRNSFYIIYSSSLICSTVLSSSNFGSDSTVTVSSKFDFSSFSVCWLSSDSLLTTSFPSNGLLLFSITSTSLAGSSLISSCFVPHFGQNFTSFSISAKQFGHCLLSFNSRHCFKFESIL